jgi:hypothetical protein
VAKKKIDTFFEGLSTAEEKARNFTAYTYIKTLAATTITDISGWDVLKVFGAEDGHLVTDKKELNKLFFDYLMKVKEKTKKKIQELEKLKASQASQDAVEKATSEELSDEEKSLAQLDLVATQLTSTVTNLRSQEERAAEEHLNYCVRNLEQSYKNVELQHNQVGAAQIKYLSMKKDPKEIAASIRQQLRTIVTKGIWVNPVFVGNHLYLNTPTNIILSHVNKAANVNISLDVGQVAVKINMNSGFAMSVIPYKENISFDKKDSGGYGYREFFHPHVNNTGAICWGNASDTYIKMIKNFDLDKALILLHALLNSYSETAPYVLLTELKAHHKKLVPNDYAVMNGSVMIHPDNIKKKTQAELDAEAAAALRAVPPSGLRFDFGVPPLGRPINTF